MSPKSQKVYLQWFPFSVISKQEKEYIVSEGFYQKYIANFSLLLFKKTLHQSDNFIQKSDGSFRDSSLISPVLYLLLQSIGKEIYNTYLSTRDDNISVYYGGNYACLRPQYKQDYDAFFKDINSCLDAYQYFIKTDINSFFSNINVDKLIKRIDRICNRNILYFSQTQLQVIKEILLYCGDGRFPLIENSIASSFLATVVYLDEIDEQLSLHLKTYNQMISAYRMVRYVDDMYILIASEKPIYILNESYNEIRNEYSSILKEYGLALNTKKCCFKETTEINSELKKSLYDEYFNGEKHNIEELFKGALARFLNDLSEELIFDSINIEKYNELIEKHFSSNDIEFTANEVFNYFIYENEEELHAKEVIEEIELLVKLSISFISLDPKRLTVMSMKTGKDKTIKAFLNQLFQRNRQDKWNSYDTIITITYLIQSKFRHVDLLDILKTKEPQLYRYYDLYCKNSFLKSLLGEESSLHEIISSDKIALYLYLMCICESKKGNWMAAFAYYKNFFDRTTADLDFKYNRVTKMKNPNYKGFYSENAFKTFYGEIAGSESIIKKAHELRNENPLSHSSANLLKNNNSSVELCDCMKNLSRLIYSYLLRASN